MFCSRCATQLAPDAVFCPQCGLQTHASPEAQLKPYRTPTSLLSVVGFVVCFLPTVDFIGIVLCAFGIAECKRYGKRGKWLATIGIIIAIFFT